MKKIFLISLVLLLPLLTPSSALAACDPTKFDRAREYAAQTCRSGDCQNTDRADEFGFHACWPPGVSGSEPTCPPGYTTPPPTWPLDCSAIIRNRCCKEGVPTYCENVSLVKDCNVFHKVTKWSEKTWCSDLKTVFDSQSKKCIQTATNEWRANTDMTKCQGVDGINTAIGCIPTGDPAKFLTFLFKWALGASGGIIVLMLILTGYNVLTSSGDPEKLKAAKENMVSIFEGFILIVFSLVLLQAVGADVLQLPTF